MSLPNDQASAYAGPAITPGDPAATLAAPASRAEPALPDGPTFDDIARTRLSEKLDMVAESADPVAELDSVVQTVAGELSRHPRADEGFGTAAGRDREIEGAIDTLVGVALEMDDPVTALEEGADNLAEALAARDVAAQEWLHAAREQHIDQQAAYRHARLHRVSELIDVGYSLDQAVAITNANEADIRARAAAAGRNPMEPIYEYAVHNGYRSAQRPSLEPSQLRRPVQAMPTSHTGGRNPSALETLAAMSDEAFAEATKGDRWQQLMRR